MDAYIGRVEDCLGLCMNDPNFIFQSQVPITSEGHRNYHLLEKDRTYLFVQPLAINGELPKSEPVHITLKKHLDDLLFMAPINISLQKSS